MATFETIRPRLPTIPEDCYAFISAYTTKRELDLIQPDMYVKQAREAKEKVKKKIEKDKKISVSIAQLQMLKQLGLA